jgi:hypothetical protein
LTWSSYEAAALVTTGVAEAFADEVEGTGSLELGAAVEAPEAHPVSSIATIAMGAIDLFKIPLGLSGCIYREAADCK